MRYVLPLFASLLLGGCAGATGPQPAARIPAGSAVAAEEVEVIAVIERLFDGMRARDSAAVRAAMHPDARLQSVATREGTSTLQAVPIDAFVRAVGASREEVWDERISRPIVHVDGDLAAAWMNYSFYVGSRFSHCGVNAMQLHRGSSGWRIIHIADTRRTDRCGPVVE